MDFGTCFEFSTPMVHSAPAMGANLLRAWRQGLFGFCSKRVMRSFEELKLRKLLVCYQFSDSNF
jgi:hypothetical protein